ncbi:SirB2 family protein [Marinobacterium litorale]|uniref:SirB2 family protein n=1 Tax=Marinobacterium litorale TaxID=404770 RepID=UPI000A0763DF|nr:SirB2 family protein [Marinobacterium litorale]
MLYTTLKHIHLLTVAVTILLFLFRAALMLWWPNQLRKRWIRVVPHINDTVLLASAIGLMLTIGQYPLVNHWLTAKLMALLAYILLGSLALHRGRSRRIRLLSLVGALVSLGYLLAVARTHSPTLGLF